jgi:hypothetical protein
MKKLLGVMILCVVIVLWCLGSGHAQKLPPYPIGFVSDLRVECRMASQTAAPILLSRHNALAVPMTAVKYIVYDRERSIKRPNTKRPMSM